MRIHITKMSAAINASPPSMTRMMKVVSERMLEMIRSKRMGFSVVL